MVNSNKNNEVNSQSRVLFVDPNPKDNIVTPEQLTISVELTTFKKSRTAIELVKSSDGKIKTYVSTGSDSRPITFIGGSIINDNESKRELTTHYTELNTNFNKSHKDLETLGIKDIQIEFNSSNVPLVKINFVDVRGKLFEMGNDSPYNVFFEMPFPIFELKVKGYYGAAVTYKLHLTKFNGSFNSSNGTFEIKCDFVGYTYAFLSDILIAYLKAIPYTEKGKRYVDAINTADDFNFLTFDELDTGVKTLESKITGLKKDDPVIGAIAKSNVSITTLEDFRITFNDAIKALAGGEGSDGEGKIIKPSPFSDNIIISKGPLTGVELSTFNQIINNFFDGENNQNDSLNQYKLNKELFKAVEGTNMFRHVKKSDFLNVEDVRKTFEEYKELKDGRQVTPAQDNEGEFRRFVEKVEAIRNNVSNGEFTIFDFKKAFDNINEAITKIRKDSSDRVSELSDEFSKKIKESFPDEAFDSSIGSFFKILCNHVDIFMDCLRDVALEAESNSFSPSRKEQLKFLNIDDRFIEFNGGNDLNSVKAFPDYRVKDADTNTLEDRWIGNLAPTMPEVIFVEDLLNGIIKARQRDKQTEDILNDSGEIINQWYPINPFDIGHFNKKNPYEIIGAEGKIYDVIRLVIERLFILDSYGNKNLTESELHSMARLEANNVFNSIQNKEIKDLLSTFYQKEPKPSLSADFMIKEATGEFKTYPKGYTNYAYSTSTPKIMELEGSNYIYTYIPDVRRDVSNNMDVFYLPLNSVNNNKNDYNGDFLMVNNGVEITEKQGINLRDSGYVFFSNPKNFIKNKLTKSDDGSTFIEIMDSEEYNKLTFSLADYGNTVLKNFTPDQNLNTFSANKLNTNLFNGKGGVTELLEINSAPVYNMFFKNTDDTPFFVSNKINKKIVRNRLIDFRAKEDNLPSNDFSIKVEDFLSKATECYIPYLGFYADSQRTLVDEVLYSLFGTDLYYQQNDKGKAFLMLSCLPFNIDNIGILNKEILSLFDSRASFVNVPYVWVLLMGAYIDRYENEYMKFSDNNFSFIPDNEIDEFPKNDEIFGFRLPSDSDLLVINSFKPLDDIVKNLPISVKNKFKKEFNDWIVSEDFKEIKDTLEIFPSDYSANDRYTFWVNAYKNEYNNNTTYSFPKTSVSNEYALACVDISNFSLRGERANTGNLLNAFIIDNSTSSLVTRAIETSKEDGTPFNFHLELKSNSKGSLLLVKLLQKTKIIVNSTWTIWNESFNIPNTELNIDSNRLRRYLEVFNEEYSKLHTEDAKLATSNKAKEVNEIKQELFNSVDSDDIKLNIYKKLKLIYEKWIAGTNEKYAGVTEGDLFKTFKFIDRSYNDISHKMLINPVSSLNHLFASYNQSFYSFISRILTDNNMDFHALPAYINYNNVEEMSKVFTPYTYNKSTEIGSVSPSFICMYIGERSNHLDLQKSNFKNDGLSLSVETNSDGKTVIAGDIPTDMQGDGDKIPIFLVNYSDSNQSIFKDIGLDQAEFTATDESLIITDSLVNNRGIGQNLFDIFNSRAYSANVEMLGNVMIQPMMYFQLNNIPMFRGLYTIIKVNHYIKANSMITSFTGSRIREVKTKMVDGSTIFINILGSLTDVNIDNASLDNLGNTIGVTSKSGRKIDALSPYITHQLGTKRGIKPSSGADDYALSEVRDFLIELGSRWNRLAITDKTKYPNAIIYNDISKIKGNRDEAHATHDNGLAIDLRLFNVNPADYEKGGTYISNSSYSREVTKDFFDVLYKLNGEYMVDPKKQWPKDRSPIELIYFNDTEIIDEFKTKTINGRTIKLGKQSGHDNHIHIKFNIPEVYREAVKDPKVFVEDKFTVNSNNDLSKALVDLGYKEGSVEHTYAYFIGKKEGYFSKNKNAAPIRNNNPGNLTGVNEFKTIDPNVTQDPKNSKFAKFSDLDKGAKALVEKKIIKWANGNYPATQTNGKDTAYQNANNVPQSVRNIAGKNVDLTFEQFTYIYAPPHENDTEGYINSIVSSLNSSGFQVTRNSKIKDYLS